MYLFRKVICVAVAIASLWLIPYSLESLAKSIDSDGLFSSGVFSALFGICFLLINTFTHSTALYVLIEDDRTLGRLKRELKSAKLIKKAINEK